MLTYRKLFGLTPIFIYKKNTLLSSFLESHEMNVIFLPLGIDFDVMITRGSEWTQYFIMWYNILFDK